MVDDGGVLLAMAMPMGQGPDAGPAPAASKPKIPRSVCSGCSSMGSCPHNSLRFPATNLHCHSNSSPSSALRFTPSNELGQPSKPGGQQSLSPAGRRLEYETELPRFPGQAPTARMELSLANLPQTPHPDRPRTHHSELQNAAVQQLSSLHRNRPASCAPGWHILAVHSTNPLAPLACRLVRIRAVSRPCQGASPLLEEAVTSVPEFHLFSRLTPEPHRPPSAPALCLPPSHLSIAHQPTTEYNSALVSGSSSTRASLNPENGRSRFWQPRRPPSSLPPRFRCNARPTERTSSALVLPLLLPSWVVALIQRRIPPSPFAWATRLPSPPLSRGPWLGRSVARQTEERPAHAGCQAHQWKLQDHGGRTSPFAPASRCCLKPPWSSVPLDVSRSASPRNPLLCVLELIFLGISLLVAGSGPATSPEGAPCA